MRILRVLSLNASPVSRTELGRLAGLESRGAHSAANRLLEDGILRLVGSGSRQQVQLEERHPLATALQALFKAEEARYDRVMAAIHRSVLKLGKSLEAAWIESEVAIELDRPGDPIVVGVLGRSGALGEAIDGLRSQLGDIEAAEDVTIEVVGYTGPDLAVASAPAIDRLAHARPIFGLPPIMSTEQGKAARARRNKVMHSDREDQQLALARHVGEILTRDPARLTEARKLIASRLENASPQERRELTEWDSLLGTMSITRLRRFLTDNSERAARLRQTMPFAFLLTPGEREELVGKARPHDA